MSIYELDLNTVCEDCMLKT